MASALRALVFGGLAATASAVVVRSAACPAAHLETSTSADAAGTATFKELTTTSGECQNMAAGDVSAFKFCGAGKLTLSRMTCDKHEYKALTVEHSKKEYSASQCETISTKGTVVDGHLGSITFTC
mmetsp:Transcript_26535/g.61372  ORF Transcript_26535/g.61372 Transcript_26535/m.61372 type:complete len:126 (+) Transcript_26535:80-457(+)